MTTQQNSSVGWQTKVEDFINSEIKKIDYFKPDGKPKAEWKVFYGENWDAARDAAREAARGAARDTARDAAWDAARDAARGAARGAGQVAARGAAWDAALLSDYLITSDLEFKDKEKHLAHGKARWEVWQKEECQLSDEMHRLYLTKPRPEWPKDRR